MRKTLYFWCFCIVAMACLPLSVSAQVVGFTNVIDAEVEVVEVLLSEGEPPPIGRRWALGLETSIVAIEVVGPNRVVILSPGQLSGLNLYDIDLESSDINLLTSIGLGSDIDLAFDETAADAGATEGPIGLWLTIDGELYAYDPYSGLLAFQTNLATEEPVMGLAWWHGDLYALTGSPIDESYLLVRLDPSTGEVLDSEAIVGLPRTGPLFHVDSMDFDEDGGLWVGQTELLTPSPPYKQGQASYFADPWGGQEPVVFNFPGLDASPRNALAVVGGFTVVEVPTLSSAGIAWLLGLLSGAGLWLLRRHSGSRA